MSECVNWPVLLAVLGLALGLFFIVLLTGCFLMGCLDVPSRADADSSPLWPKTSRNPAWPAHALGDFGVGESSHSRHCSPCDNIG